MCDSIAQGLVLEPRVELQKTRAVEGFVGESLNLVVRWIHVIAAIMWIGSSIFFHWLDRSITAPKNRAPGVEGELWMVHGGGFYQVEKKHVAPDQIPETLHWFKWEAGFTWLSGLLLLIIVYHLGGGILLVDAGRSTTMARIAGLGVLPLGWLVYDAIWRSPLGQQRAIALSLSIAFGVGIVFALTSVMSGRAAYLHTGAMLGTIMVGNVWGNIIPAQRALVEAVAAGRAPDPARAKAAKNRSTHNHYLTYPVIFIMLSNHFPSTYGSAWSWAILLGLMLASGLVKHWMNIARPSPRVLLGGIL